MSRSTTSAKSDVTVLFVCLVIAISSPGCAPKHATPGVSTSGATSELSVCEMLLRHVKERQEAASNEPQVDDRTSTSSISLIQEIDLGDETSRMIAEKFSVNRSGRVEEIFSKVVKHADRPSLSYDIRLLGRTEQLNAFSITGGRVYITEALIDALEPTDGELAFIIGHEIAHAALRHMPNFMEASYADFYSRVMICDAVSRGQVEASTVVPTFQVLDIVASFTSVAREFEADQYGALYAMQAGYHFSDAMSALRKIRRLLGDQSNFGTAYGDVADRLSGSIASLPTHPPISERLEQLDRFRNQIAEVIKRTEEAENAMRQGEYARASLDFANALKVFPESRSLRMNIALVDHLAFRKSAPVPPGVMGFLTTPQKLELEMHNVVMRSSTRGTQAHESDFEMLNRAIDGYRATLDRDPTHALARNNLAVAYMDLGEIDIAIEELSKASSITPDFATAHKNLALAYCRKLEQMEEGASIGEMRRIIALARISWDSFNAHNGGALHDNENRINQLLKWWDERLA